MNSSKKSLYLKLLEVFCKFEDKLVRPNQQEIVINFTRDISKNNLIYLFSNEGISHLTKIIQRCLPEKDMFEGASGGARMSMEVFNVMVCLNLMSVCCEGKSDLAEQKCQMDIVNLQTAVILYRESGILWPFKCVILNYVRHCYIDSANAKLFTKVNGNDN